MAKKAPTIILKFLWWFRKYLLSSQNLLVLPRITAALIFLSIGATFNFENLEIGGPTRY
jgi:hypothetical protein